MICGIMDISVVYLSIFSNSQFMSVINNNDVPIYECFRVSWYTKQRPAMMYTYMDKVEPTSTWWVKGTYHIPGIFHGM